MFYNCLKSYKNVRAELSLSESYWNTGKWPGIVAWKAQAEVGHGFQEFA